MADADQHLTNAIADVNGVTDQPVTDNVAQALALNDQRRAALEDERRAFRAYSSAKRTVNHLTYAWRAAVKALTPEERAEFDRRTT